MTRLIIKDFSKKTSEKTLDTQTSAENCIASTDNEEKQVISHMFHSKQKKEEMRNPVSLTNNTGKNYEMWREEGAKAAYPPPLIYAWVFVFPPFVKSLFRNFYGHILLTDLRFSPQ